ncbi:MAG: TadE/TadG family type IV pilus assembly protein [Tabrizicola sp.]
MRSLKHRFRSFLHDEDGLVLAEGLLMLPLVVWALVAMFIYWDVFRTINVTQKAAYGIADLLSRQRDTISTDFANGLQNVMDFLTPGGHPVKMRITSLECQGVNGGGCTTTDGTYRLLFSFSPGGKVPPLTQTDIQAWKAVKIPVLNNQESVFVVETSVEFKAQLQTAIAGFMVGVEDATYGQFIVTKPRHRRLCLQGTTTCN